MSIDYEIIDGKVNGKSVDRIPKGYKVGESDWKAQLNMLLRDGISCKDCIHCGRCCLIFGQKETDTSCQFYPSRFYQKTTHSAQGLIDARIVVESKIIEL